MNQRVRRAPSGLMPMGPPRPALREPLPVRPWAVLAGLAGGGTWLLLFGQIAVNLPGYAGWVCASGAAAWVAAVVLARHGDRGVSAGIALAVAIGWSTTAVAVAVAWIRSGDWPLW